MNTPTNTKGVIAAAAEKKKSENSKPLSPVQNLSRMLNSGGIQNQLKQTLKENSGAFTASLINLFNNDKELQTCAPEDVLAEALKAAALQLPIEKSLGFAYVIKYKDKPQFQLGYKGMLQLCLRSGAYRHINAGVIYEGENVDVDKLSGTIRISGEPSSDKAAGYFAYVKTHDGFEHGLYWDKKKVEAHKKKFSKSDFVWGKNFDAMATKTVLKNLLAKFAPMSVISAIETEDVPAQLPENINGAEIDIDAVEKTAAAPEVSLAESAPETVPPAPEASAEGNEDYPFG